MNSDEVWTGVKVSKLVTTTIGGVLLISAVFIAGIWQFQTWAMEQHQIRSDGIADNKDLIKANAASIAALSEVVKAMTSAQQTTDKRVDRLLDGWEAERRAEMERLRRGNGGDG